MACHVCGEGHDPCAPGLECNCGHEVCCHSAGRWFPSDEHMVRILLGREGTRESVFGALVEFPEMRRWWLLWLVGEVRRWPEVD